MSLSPDEFVALRAGTLQIDALDIELRRSESGTLVYSGPGQFTMTEEGDLKYVLFDPNANGEVDWATLPLSGSWISPDSFFDLSATDWRGRRWTASQILVDTSGTRGKPGVVCRGELWELTLTSKTYMAAGESISLFAPYNGDIPLHLVTAPTVGIRGSKLYRMMDNVWEVVGPEYVVRITQAEDGLQIDATRASGTFAEHFDMRLMESIWFLLASPLDWHYRIRVNTKDHSLTIRRRPDPLASTRLRPPLEFTRRLTAEEPCGRMLQKYLEYVGEYPAPYYHPTSISVRRMLLASAISIETGALVLSIAVESFIRREYSELGTPDNWLIAALEPALEFWQQWTGPSDLKQRIQNAIKGMKGSNPREAMNKLVNAGVLDPEHRTVWNKLRHTSAHGLELGADFRQLAKLCDITHAALLRLIFSRIGYGGPYTDRTTPGWPDIHYP